MGYYKPLSRNIKRGQRYGERPNLGPNPAGGHNGDDYLSWVGEPVHAAGDGVVIHAGQFDSTYADNFGWNLNFGGNMVILNLDGAEGPYVEYGHLSDVYVTAGQRVSAGEVIALTGDTDGNTGVISGPHLHVGCLPPNFDLNTSTYGRVNPDLYLTDYWDGPTIALQSSTITPLEEGFLMALTEDEQRRVLAAADMALDTPDRPNPARLLNSADGGYIVALLESLSGKVLNKEDGGYIVGLVSALKPGNTDPTAIAAAVVAAVGKDIAGEVVKSISEKLGAA